MPIICQNKTCIYQELGECQLTHAAAAGPGNVGSCAYYIESRPGAEP